MENENNCEGRITAFKIGDIVFNKLRPYLHKVYFADREGGTLGELLIITSNGKLAPKFLFYKLFSKSFIDIVDSATQGTKKPRANWNDFICTLPVDYPAEITEQNLIVGYLDEVIKEKEDAISKINREIELLKEYKKALISEVVTGKIKIV